MVASTALGRVPLAGDVMPAPPPSQYPVPDVPATFTYGSQTALRGLTRLGVAGAGAQATYPGGGILLTPLPDRGVMRVQAWWPDAPGLQLIRITPDGARTPVRSGYPVTATVATRTNWCANPGVEVASTGYSVTDGSATLARVADGAEGAWSLRATATSAGPVGIGVPHSMPVAPGATVAVALRLSAAASSVTLSVAYTNSAGGALTTQTVTLTADQINASVTLWARHVMTAVAPVGAAAVGVIKLVAAGMPLAGTMDLDAVVVEQGATDGVWFGGDSFGGTWTGTTGLSTSRLAPILTVDDGECPLDTAVTYQAYNPSLVGGRVTSEQAVLDGAGRTWLTHPVRPDSPITVDLRVVPTLEHEVDQGVFYPLDSPYAVVVSAQTRRAATGDIRFNAISAAEKQALERAFADLQPVLLRTPDDVHYPDQWIALGKLTIDPEGRKAWQDAWLLSAPFWETGVPDAALYATA